MPRLPGSDVIVPTVGAPALRCATKRPLPPPEGFAISAKIVELPSTITTCPDPIPLSKLTRSVLTASWLWHWSIGVGVHDTSIVPDPCSPSCPPMRTRNGDPATAMNVSSDAEPHASSLHATAAALIGQSSPA